MAVERMIPPRAIRRLHFGHFTLENQTKTASQKVVVCGYLIDHPDGLVLFDTGIGEGDPSAEEHYRPVRTPLRDALGEVAPDDVDIVVNCHLHADHAGGNPVFAGKPIFAQRAEHEAAQEPDYTIPALIDFEGARYELHDGEADVLPGLRVIPTPGHSPGHQALVVDTTAGRYILAGQATNFASNFATSVLEWELAQRSVPDLTIPPWIERIQELGARRVLFAHDLAVWDADPLAD